MKTESLPTQDSDAAGSTGTRSERTLIHHNSELSQHLKQYLVAQLQGKDGGQPGQPPAGFWHQAPAASSSDYHLPPADKIIHVKLSAGETTFHVPANTTFDTIRVVGHDLVLVQKDGTAIVLEDAGDKIPNIEIGDVDIPKVALEAAFTANGIQAAEGPSGNSAPSSGGSFEDARASTLGNGRGLTGFLGQEGFNFNGTSIHYPPPPLPEIKLNTNAEPTLTLSETHLTATTNGVDGSDPNAALTTISADFSVDFTPTPDVNGGAVTYALSIHGGNGTASGFIDSQTGLADVLVQNGNTIEGHVGNANGALAFTISVNPNTGVVTFTEDRAVFETQTGTNPSANIATMSANVVTLTATITDGLGHQASASLDLGKQISLTDDSPSIVADAATVPGLTLSEADLTAATNNGVNGSSPNAALTSVTGHFASDFTDTSGADGLKSTTYALSIAGGNGTASGLVDSQTGQADVLVQNGNTIEGHVGSATGALAFTITLDPATGDITFTEDRAVQNNDTGSTGASLAAGVVTLTQTIVDNDGSTANANIDLGAKLAITDDGPSIVANAATVPGLTLSETDLTAATNGGVDGSKHDGATTVVGHFAADFTDTSGADGLKSTTYALSIVGGDGTASGLIDSQTGSKDVLVLNGNTIEGHVGSTTGELAFTITLDPATGDITFTEDRAVENNNTGSTGVSLASGVVTLTQTITDNDGTVASANVDLGPKLSITDDGPSITTNAAPTLTLSESNLTFFKNGINGTDPDFKLTHTSADFSKAFNDTSGADGLKSVAYVLSISHQGVASGLTDSQTGQADILFQNGNTVTGFVGHSGTVAFTITIDPKTGELTFTEDRAVVQTQDGSDPSGNAAALASGVVTLTQTITDNDGTTASASVDVGSNLSITDDGPKISTAPFLEPGLLVSESHLTSQTNGVSGTDPNSFLTHATGNFSFAFIDNPGADGLKSVSYTLTLGNGGVSGLVDSQMHQNDVLVQTSATTITGYVGSQASGIVAFMISVDPHTGVVTFTEDRAVVQAQNGHDPSQDLASFASGAVTLTQTLVDNDGTTTSASLDISQQLAIADDGPRISVSQRNESTLSVSEADLQASTNVVDGTVHNGLTTATGNFSGNFSDTFGADGAAAKGSVSYALSIGNPAPRSNVVLSGLVDSQTHQDDVLVQVNATTIEGHVGSANGALAFTISVDPTSGIVTFTEDRAVVQQQNGQDPSGDIASLTNSAVVLTQTITDGDGTTASANLDIGAQLQIKDDGPHIVANSASVAPIVLSESDLTSSTNVINGTTPDKALTTAVGQFAGDFTDTSGADGLKSVSYALTLNGASSRHPTVDSGLIDTQTGLHDVLVQSGNTITAYVGSYDSHSSNNIVAFTITLDPSSGSVTFTEDRSVENNGTGATGVSLRGLITLTQTLVDNDGTTTSANIDLGSKLAITDDKPTDVLSGAAEPALTVHEANLTAATNGGNDGTVHNGLTSASGNFSADFTHNFGADGQAGKGAVSYALTIGNSASGLVDTQTGHAVTLVQNGSGEIDGVITISGNVTTVFTITVDAAGNVTFTEDRAVKEVQDGSDPSGKAATLASGTVLLTQTITDGDGTSTTSPNLDIGQQLSITDDSPQITIVAGNEPTLTLSESNIVATLDNGFTAGTHPDFAATSTMANFSSVFTDVSGADGKAAVGYSLTIGNNGDSGLKDTLTRDEVMLVKNGANEVDGVIKIDGFTVKVFTVQVDGSGNVTFTEDRSVENNNTGSTGVSLASGALMLGQTLTDGDGTTKSAQIDLGVKLAITDDTPTITLTHATEPTLTVHEADLQASTNGGINGTLHNGLTSTSPTSFAGAFSDHFGADGTGSVNYALTVGNGGVTNLTDTQSASAVTLHQVNATEIDGRDANGDLVFKLKVDSSGEVTFTLDRAVENSSGPVNVPASSVVLTQTITDGDGSTASASVNIGSQLSISDDAPKAPVLTASHTVGVDETPGVQTSGGATDVLYSSLPSAIAALFSGLTNHGTDTNVPSNSLDHGALSFAASSGSLVTVSTPVYGADGPAMSGSEVYALKLENGGMSGLKLTDGTSITLSMSNGMIIGTTGTDSHDSSLSNKIAFAIAIDPSSGEVYVAQYLSLNDNDQGSVMLASGSVGVTVTLTDGDGSQSSSTTDISSHVQFYDDGPSIGAIQTAYVADVANSSFNGTWAPTFGADGPSLKTPVSLAMGTAPAGTTYTVTDTHTLINTHEVFEVHVSGTASYTFYEYTLASATGTEMFAFTDEAGANQFFTLDVSSNGNYTFHLDTTSLPSGTPVSREATFTSLVGAQGDNSDAFLDFVNGAGTFHTSSQSGVDLQISATNSQGTPVLDAFAGGELGAGVGSLPDGSAFDLQFGTNQTSVTLGVASVGGSNITTTITIENSAGQSSTETVTLNGSNQSITIDSQDWKGGANNPFLSGFDEIIVAPANNGAVSLTSVSYEAGHSVSVTPSQLDFNVGATDGDGDSTSGNLAVNLVAPPVAVAGSYVESVSESGLPTGSNPNHSATVDTVQVSFTAGTDNANVTLDPSALTTALPGFQGLTWQVVNGVVEGFQGSTEVVSFAITSGATIEARQTGTVTVTETLLVPIDGDNGGTAGDLGKLNVVASDVNNPSINATDQITVGVLDDKPVAVADVAADTSGQTLSANVITGAGETSGKDTAGADGGLSVVGVEAGSFANATLTTGVGVAIAGTYGTLTLAADGSYTYKANPDTTGLTGTHADTFTYTIKDADGSTSTTTLAVNVNEVHPTATAVVGTVYEAGLSDGSGVGPTTTVLQGTLPFSENGDTVTITSVTSGGVTVPIPQDGSNFAFGTGPYPGEHGILHINDNGTYTYTLIGPETGVNGVEAPDVFTYTVTDSHGNTTTSTLTINIVDDKPVAVADVATDASGYAQTGNVATNDLAGADGGLSVVGVEAGSNTGTVMTGVGTAIGGTYGTLTLAADGSYTYKANPDTAGLSGNQTDTFTYTIKDADGSTSTTTLTIDVNEVQPTVAAVTGTVYEAGLANGSHVETTTVQQGTLSFTESGDTVTLKTIVFNDTTYNVPQDGSNLTITGAHSTLVINDNGVYTYTLTGAETASGGTQAPDTFAYTVADTHGNTNSSTLSFGIVDDAPVAHQADLQALDGGAAEAGQLFGPSGVGDQMGADRIAGDTFTGGANVTGVVSVNEAGNTATSAAGGPDGTSYKIAGEYGTLTLSQDGSYSYQANDNAKIGQTDSFTYTLTDGDGSTATASIVVTVEAGQAATGGGNSGVLVDESQLTGGTGVISNPAPSPSTSVQFTAGADDLHISVASMLSGLNSTNGLQWAVNATKPDEIDATQGGKIVAELVLSAGTNVTDEGNGTFAIAAGNTGSIEVTETLMSAISGEGTAIGNLGTLTLTAVDAANPSVASVADQVNVTAIDDKPVANEFTASVQQGTALTETTANGLFGSVTGDKIGADGPSASGDVTGVAAATAAATSATAAVSGHVDQTVTDADGSTLVLNTDGSFTFTASATATVGLTDYFTYTITDGDGSTATNSLAFTITAPPPPATPQLEVFEAGLNFGSSPGSSSTPTQSLASIGVSNLQSVSFDSNWTRTLVAPTGYHWFESFNATELELVGNGPFGNAVLLLTFSSSGHSLVETLEDPIIAPATDGVYNLGSVTVDTPHGGPETFTVGVVDDSPVANAASFTAVDGTTTSTNAGLLAEKNVGGAGDSYGADGAGGVTSVSTGGTTVNLTGIGGSATITGQFGTLTLHGNGTYSYAANHNDMAGSKDVFTYTLTDADGSTSSNTLTVTIGAGAAPQAGTVSTALSMNESLLASGSGVAGAAQHPTATASFTAGADDAHVTLQSITLTNAISGLSEKTVSGTEIDVYQMQGATNVEVATLILSGNTTIAAGTTGSVTVTETLLAAIEGNDGHSTLGTLNVVASDTLNGGSATDQVGVNVVDDAPVFQSTDHLVITSAAVPGDLTGNIHYLSGADMPATFAFTGVSTKENQQTATSLTSGGHAVTEWVDTSGVLHGVANGQDVFTLSLHPSTGTYDFDLLQDVAPKSGSSSTTLTFDFDITDNDGSQTTGAVGINVGSASFTENYGNGDSGLMPFNGSYHELTDSGASSTNPYTLIGDSSNDIFLVNFASETMQAHSATSGNNIFEIANLGNNISPNELITNFNTSHDVIDLTQLLNNVPTGANLSNYVEYLSSSSGTGSQAGELLINETGGGFGTNHTGTVLTVATIDTNVPTNQTPAVHPTAASGSASPILIAYQDQTHLHSVHAHTG